MTMSSDNYRLGTCPINVLIEDAWNTNAVVAFIVDELRKITGIVCSNRLWLSSLKTAVKLKTIISCLR